MNRQEYLKQYCKEWRKNNPDKVKQYHKNRDPVKVKAKNKRNNTINHPKQLVFRGKRLLLKENPRVGVCNLCRAVKGIDCKRTHIHHIKYHKDDPLKDTIEVCQSCHNKIHLHHKHNRISEYI